MNKFALLSVRLVAFTLHVVVGLVLAVLSACGVGSFLLVGWLYAAWRWVFLR